MFVKLCNFFTEVHPRILVRGHPVSISTWCWGSSRILLCLIFWKTARNQDISCDAQLHGLLHFTQFCNFLAKIGLTPCWSLSNKKCRIYYWQSFSVWTTLPCQKWEQNFGHFTYLHRLVKYWPRNVANQVTPYYLHSSINKCKLV